MEIGIDDIDFISDDLSTSDIDNITNQDNSDYTSFEEDNITDNQELSESTEDEDIITSLLKSRGIEDRSRIKFENEEGETEEINWDSLNNETKLNILNSSSKDSNVDLDDLEIQLINAVRQSNLTPSEYIQYIQQIGINSYLNNNQITNLTFKVDELSDEELYVTDLITRTGVTEEEAIEALDRAKANENLFNKLIGAIRQEYQKSEQELLQYNEFKKQELALAQFNQFANGVVNEIQGFTEFAGYDLNMSNEDMQELYDFITGFDAAGNSYFGKALNDPATLVKMAWFALNGEQMIQDIDSYYKKEISNVRKESYNKGLLANKDKPNVVYKNVQNTKRKSSTFDDLDDF